jgi:hypothetical protein
MIAKKDQTKTLRAVLLAGSAGLAALSLGACSSVVPSEPQSFAVRNADGSIYDPANPATFASSAPPPVETRAEAPSNAGPPIGGYHVPPLPPDPPPAAHRLASLTAPGITHDLGVAGGGYVVGRQAESVIRKLKNRSVAAAGDTAETAGAGAGTVAASRAATSGTIATGESATVAEGGAAGATEAATAGEATIAGTAGEAAIAGETAEAGLFAGASEFIVPGLIVFGVGSLIYEAYQNSRHDQQEKSNGGQ